MAVKDQDVEFYLKEISKYSLLTRGEETELARLIAQGDREARRKLTRGNLRLVVSIAKNYQGRGLSLMDLIEEGNIGLIKAVERFNPAHDCKFSTYASWWIKQTIRRALINKVKAVRVPAYMVELIGKWKKQAQKFIHKYNREPADEEMAELLDMDIPKVAAIRRAISTSTFAESSSGQENAVGLDEILASVAMDAEDEGILKEYGGDSLRHALDFALTEREQRIVEMRYGLGEFEKPLTLENIGVKIGLTRERIRQIENQALKKLLKFLTSHEEFHRRAARWKPPRRRG